MKSALLISTLLLAGTTDLDGVRLTVDASLFPDAKTESVPAQPLADASEKPDGVAPAHVVTRLATHDPKTFFAPEIRIYPIEGFREAYAAAPRYWVEVDADVKRLRELLAQSEIRAESLPFIPFIDASETFHARAHRIGFLGGTGIAALVQYEIEPSLVNNGGLTYYFVGLTTDGKRLVHSTIPVRSLLAAESYETIEHSGYKLPSPFDAKKHEAERRAYVKRVSEALSRLPSTHFSHDLDRLDAMFRSIEIR